MQELIDAGIRAEVLTKLDELAAKHQVTIISAIESGSRSWGFPSPDSDYDVRFVYAHTPDWYIQLNPERDVIELPVNAVLDIGGWDVRKAMALANSGNSVIQDKTTKTETESGVVDPLCLAFIREAYKEVMAADSDILPARGIALDNGDLRGLLHDAQAT